MHYRTDRRRRVTDLTAKQRQVLDLLASGLSKKEVAAALGIDQRGLSKRVKWLERRFECRSTLQLMVVVVRKGVL